MNTEIPDMIRAILHEPAIYEDEFFVIVQDRDPVVPGHLLALPKRNVASFADLSLATVDTLLNQLIAALPMPYGLIERGRAKFCSSFSTIYAHAHLVPKDILASADMPGGEEYALIVDALTRVPTGEYLIAGPLGGPFTLCTPKSDWSKRYIRHLIHQGSQDQ